MSGTEIRRRVERLPDYSREDWATGEWDGEPDLVEWRDARYPDFALLVVRSHTSGGLCGYVGLPPSHPLHGKPYEDLELEVHGGLTYAGSCAGHICHVPAPGEPDDVWWLGFDCGHASDVSPGLDAFARKRLGAPHFKFEYAHYRPLVYVMSEVEQLASQLAGRDG